MLPNPRANARRWWLPGPPPPRRLVSLQTVEESYHRDGISELAVPVRSITLRSRKDYASVLASYTCISSTSSPEPIYLFHGCGNSISHDVTRSFSRWGPSIRFSRARSYFSAGPAVYWSNSLEFAIAWSFFAETGSWDMSLSRQDTQQQQQQPFVCLVYMSKVSMQAMNSVEHGLYLIPEPESRLEEEELEEWCNGNLDPGRRPSPLAPPKTKTARWGIVGSRIPRSTMQALEHLDGNIDKIWLFASCNEASSRVMAEGGVEVG
ncbi:hypothetical protein QBC44DRAFT_239005 [Cladorrhinum sp. PSN332]|nr:hypothetical protein QBC44DRAFT_239005 [Cladorrhinum sp. PSN332]